MNTTQSLHAIGFTTEQTECDSCGRMELRGTVILANDEGEVARMGTTCASKAIKVKITRQNALNLEAVRKYTVRDELVRGLKALEAGDLPAVRMYLEGAVKLGIVLGNEQRAAAKLRDALR